MSTLAAALMSLIPSARANVILNGDFTSFPTTGAGSFPAKGGGISTGSDYSAGGTLNNWIVSDVNGSTGLALLYTAGPQGSTTANEGQILVGRFGNFSVYDPGNTTSGTGGAIPNASPGAGNFIVGDGAVGYQVAVYQTLTNLVQGGIYSVSFWYAAGQQYNFTGTTTEGWQVSLTSAAQLTQVTNPDGIIVQDTPTQAGGGLAQGAFQPWAQETLTFTASATNQVLTFLALGTPSGQPPVDFLSDVVMTQVTPEPGTVAMLLGGLISIGFGVAVRRKRNP